MWKSAYVGVYQLLNWKMPGETLKFKKVLKNLDSTNMPGSVALPNVAYVQSLL